MTKGPQLQKLMDSLPAKRKKQVKARAAELKKDYLTLQELRKEAGLTQAAVSKALDMPQSNVSRLESGSDMLYSTLSQYIEAIGGKLDLTVQLPGKRPLHLSGLGDLVEHTAPNTHRKNTTSSKTQ